MISKPTHYFDLTEIYPVLISFFNCNVPLPRPFYGEIQDCKNRIAQNDYFYHTEKDHHLSQYTTEISQNENIIKIFNKSKNERTKIIM